MRSLIKISGTMLNCEYMVEMAMFNVQMAITPKVGKPELRFILFACCLIVLYNCMKFRETILNGFELTERTRIPGRNGYVQCSKGNNFKSRQTGFTIHVLCEV